MDKQKIKKTKLCIRCKCFTCAENCAINSKHNENYPNRCIGCSYCFSNQHCSITEKCRTYKEKKKKQSNFNKK